MSGKPVWPVLEVSATTLATHEENFQTQFYNTTQFYQHRVTAQGSTYHQVPDSLVLFHATTWLKDQHARDCWGSWQLWTRLTQHGSRSQLLLTVKQQVIGQPRTCINYLWTRPQIRELRGAVSLMLLGALVPPQEHLTLASRRKFKRFCPDKVFFVDVAQSVGCPNKLLVMQLLQTPPRNEGQDNYPTRMQTTLASDDEVTNVWFPVELLTQVEPLLQQWETFNPTIKPLDSPT